MGTADIVPGVSGGTIAVLFGIYKRWLGFIRGVGSFAGSIIRDARMKRLPGPESLKNLDISFGFWVLTGALAAIFLLTSILQDLLRDYPEAMAGLFMGLVLAAAVLLFNSLFSSQTEVHWGTSFIALVAGGVFFWLLGFQSGPVSSPSLIVFLGSGFLAATALLLPGISGAFVLLMLGMYEVAISAVSDFEFLRLLIFGLGAVLGLLIWAPVFYKLLSKFEVPIKAVLTGLMLGSVRVLWPWPDGVGILSRDSDKVVRGTGLELPDLNGVWIPCLLAAAGFFLALVIQSRVRKITLPRVNI